MEAPRRDAGLRLRRVALLALAALALLAGCGGGEDGGEERRLSKDEYQREAAASLERVKAALRSASEGDLEGRIATAEFLEGAAGPLRELSRDIGSLRPPEEVDAENAALAAAIGAFSDDLIRAAVALRAGDLGYLRRQGSLESPETARGLNDALAALARKGYDFSLAPRS